MFFKRTTPIVVSDELLQELRFQANDEGRNASDPPTPWQPHTHTSSLQIGRCKLPEGYSTLTQVCCTNGVFTTV